MSHFSRLLTTAQDAFFGRGVPRRKTTRDSPIVDIHAPPRVRLPVHGLEVLVAAGQAVEGGRLIARTPAAQRFQRRVHASLTGTVTAVEDGHVVLEGVLPERRPLTHSEPEWIAPEAITDTAREAGLIGMGGAMFPSYVKLSRGTPIDVVLINGCESEPYLTCDHRVLVEHLEEVRCGMGLAMHAVGAERGLIADRETYYPGGYERLLIHDATGRVVPPRGLPRDVGTLVLNVQSARALHQAICLGRPLLDRVLTVAGDAVGKPGNYRVPIGTEVGHLLDLCEVDVERAAAILTGGPMMGRPAERQTPITGGTGGVLALTAAERYEAEPQPCFRCGQCLEVCPFDLAPAFLVEQPHKSVLGCVECGACQYTCPASRPLIEGLRRAKSVVTAWD